jgi:DNA mismatch endonuclease (patch repair protein)
MPDVLTREQRHYNMSRIRNKRTKPELKVKDIFESLGFEYQPRGIYGKPDFVNRNRKIAIFIDGCFWHKCPEHFVKPKTRTEFWMQKIEKNVIRDELVNIKLENEGWKVLRIWEHDIKRQPEKVIAKVKKMLKL